MLSFLKQFSDRVLTPDLVAKKRYKIFQKLLQDDRRSHELLAELEEIYYHCAPVDTNRLRFLYEKLSTAVAAMVSDLRELAPGRYRNLPDYFKKIDYYSRFALAPPKTDAKPPYVLPLDTVYKDDHSIGGKGLHLSELAAILDMPVPRGFILSTSAWNQILNANRLRPKIARELAKLDIHSAASLTAVSERLMALVAEADIPAGIEDALSVPLQDLASTSSLFAVRSSAVGEDSSFSFAGLYRSLLHVEPNQLLAAYRGVLASKYAPEALFYRVLHGLDDDETPMAVIVSAMVNAQMSGVIISFDPAEPEGQPISVCSVTGLGDSLMSGRKTPAVVELRSEAEGFVISRRLGHSQESEPSDPQLIKLAGWAKKIADYYGSEQEIEWSCDRNGSLFLLQTRNRTGNQQKLRDDEPDLSSLPLLFQGGSAASFGMGSGPACHYTEPESVPTGDGVILVCDVTPPDLVTLLPHVSGVIARCGSVADHFSSVAREFGVPVLVQTGNSFSEVKNGDPLTLWAEKGRIYRGRICHPATEGIRKLLDQKDNPLLQTLKMVIGFTSPLSLVEPAHDSFVPENCRSLHDIIRFCHEKSIQAMFLQSTDILLRKPKGSLLQTDIPLQAYFVDVGGGLSPDKAGAEKIVLDDLCCLPFRALWQGLSHPGMHWGKYRHYDWRSYDAVALAGGITAGNASSLASYFLISSEYFNASFRFGYHFTLLDCLCTDNPEENYVLLRFAGGGGKTLGKDLRLSFITKVLLRLGFSHERQGDVLDARLTRYGKQETLGRLGQLGRLLGAVRLLDMTLTHEEQLEPMVTAFFQGKCNFSPK
jgi:pyruvate,water dikinase